MHEFIYRITKGKRITTEDLRAISSAMAQGYPIVFEFDNASDQTKIKLLVEYFYLIKALDAYDQSATNPYKKLYEPIVSVDISRITLKENLQKLVIEMLSGFFRNAPESFFGTIPATLLVKIVDTFKAVQNELTANAAYDEFLKAYEAHLNIVLPKEIAGTDSEVADLKKFRAATETLISHNLCTMTHILLKHCARLQKMRTDLLNRDRPEDQPEFKSLSMLLVNIGGLLVMMRKYSESIPYYLEALEIRERINSTLNHRNISSLTMNLAAVYFGMFDTDNAIRYYQRTINCLAGEENNTLAECYEKIARIQCNQYSQYRESLTNFRNSNNIISRLLQVQNVPRRVRLLEMQRGNCFCMAIAHEALCEYPQAIEALDKAFALAASVQTDQSHRVSGDIHKKYMDIHQKSGNPDRAFEHGELAIIHYEIFLFSFSKTEIKVKMRIERTLASIFLSISEVYRAQGKVEEAKRNFDKATEHFNAGDKAEMSWGNTKAPVTTSKDSNSLSQLEHSYEHRIKKLGM